MTSQDKKRYLMRYLVADRHINELLEEKERMQAMLERITPTYSDGRGSVSNNDKITNGVAKIIEIEKKIDREIDDLYEYREHINNDISKLHDNRMYRVLYLRYIAGYRWDRIALEMGYEVRQIYRLHGQALRRLDVSECQLISWYNGTVEK